MSTADNHGTHGLHGRNGDGAARGRRPAVRGGELRRHRGLLRGLQGEGLWFLEAVYQECLAIEFGLRGIPFEEQPTLGLTYKAHQLRQTYQPDFVCYGKIVLEVKAVSALTDEHRAQLHNYLKASSLRLGLLVNFGHYPKLEYARIIR